MTLPLEKIRERVERANAFGWHDEQYTQCGRDAADLLAEVDRLRETLEQLMHTRPRIGDDRVD